MPFKKFLNKLLRTLPGFVLYNPQAESQRKRFKCNHLLVSHPCFFFFGAYTFKYKRSFVFFNCRKQMQNVNFPKWLCLNYISSTNYSCTLCLQALLLSSSYCSFPTCLKADFTHTQTHTRRTRFASWRWELGVGTRHLMETGHTRREYWWEAVRIPLMPKSDSHTRAHDCTLYTTFTFVIPVTTCSLLHLSLTYFDMKSIVSIECQLNSECLE